MDTGALRWWIYLRRRRSFLRHRAEQRSSCVALSREEVETLLVEGVYQGLLRPDALCDVHCLGRPCNVSQHHRNTGLDDPVTVLGDGDPVDNAHTEPTIQALANRTAYAKAFLDLLGALAAPVQVTAGRLYLALKGTTDAGVLEVLTGASDVDNRLIGMVQFTDILSGAADKAIARIKGRLNGSTLGNRGGKVVVEVKSDGNNTHADIVTVHKDGVDVTGAIAPQAGSPLVPRWRVSMDRLAVTSWRKATCRDFPTSSLTTPGSTALVPAYLRQRQTRISGSIPLPRALDCACVSRSPIRGPTPTTPLALPRKCRRTSDLRRTFTVSFSRKDHNAH
jgi:hypothetical protein